MNTRSTWCALLLVILVGGCSSSVPPTAAPTPPPSPTLPPATFAPPPTPEPSVDPNQLPPTTTTGWWGDPDKPTECMRPGSYRIGYRVADLGDCSGMLNEGPKTITLDVGEDFDLHMTIPADGAPPIWPLPVAEDELVAFGWLIFDDATMTYRALSPGTTRLVTQGACYRGAGYGAVPTPGPGTCPVLVIHVRDIATKCVDLPADVCRAVGAAAVRADWIIYPGQRIVGWVAEPDSFIGDASCGDGVAKVTFTLEDPAGTVSIQIGRRVPEPSGPPHYSYCTY